MNKTNPANLRICICQINPTVGDISGNAKKILSYIKKAKRRGADLAVFPELSLTGYPPEDLLLKPHFIRENLRALKKIAQSVRGISAVIGLAGKNGQQIFNSAALIGNGKVIARHDKVCLPNYGVFDEKRYFSSGKRFQKLRLKGFRAVIAVCEDLWDRNGIQKMVRRGAADLIISANASPFHAGKWQEREKLVRDLARRKKAAVIYANIVGGQDEIVFDGMSFAADSRGNILAKASQFTEDMVILDISPDGKGEQRPLPAAPERTAEIYGALTLGLRDYAEKNGFKRVVLGVSGGIDSAVVAAIAADSLGKDNVKAVFMPSKYTSRRSLADASALAKNLGIELLRIDIGKPFAAFLSALGPVFKGTRPNIAEENLQARIRGTLLMALSNKFGYLLLATGNKSEVSTGYSTLYGDMAGGLSVIKDVPKTLVYELARYRNKISRAVPESTIKRAPTAELRPRQKDEDSLPPYPVLDRIIREYIEKDRSAEEIIRSGLPRATVRKAVSMMDSSEYKRRQSAPGIKITPKAFGRGRRMPITNKFR